MGICLPLGPIMDSNSEDREYHSLEHAFPQDAAQYKVTDAHRRNTHDVSWVTHKDISVHCMLIFVLFITNVFANTDR